MMSTIERLRRYSLLHLLCAGALLGTFGVGCGAGEPVAGSASQNATETGAAAACSSAELDPLVACSAEPCSGLAGDPLNECMGDSCPESVFDVSQGCGECIIVNLSSVEDIAHFCGAPAQPTAAACTAGEMDPIVACSAEPCASMSGDPLNECMADNCPDTVWDVSEPCAMCIIGNLAGVDVFAQACGG